MRTKEVKVYTFDELSGPAKEKAREWFLQGMECGGSWAREWKASMVEAGKFLPFEIIDWSVGDYRTFAKIRVRKEQAEDLAGVRLWKWLRAGVVSGIPWFNLGVDPHASCPFTGYCGDESLLQPIRDFLTRPDMSTTGRELFQACADQWAYDWQQDMEYQMSYESVDENILCNEYTFDENGRIT